MFEGNSASEWKGTVVSNYPTLGSNFTTNSASYSRLEGLEIVNFGSTSETLVPAGTTKTVYTPPFRDKHYTLSPGESITQTQTATTTSTFPPAPTTTTTTTNTHTIRYLGQENVTVPAGTFAACKFEYEGVLTSWEIKGKAIQAKSVTVTNTNEVVTLVLTSGTVNGSPVAP
jgi:hypothetical protein